MEIESRTWNNLEPCGSMGRRGRKKSCSIGQRQRLEEQPELMVFKFAEQIFFYSDGLVTPKLLPLKQPQQVEQESCSVVGLVTNGD